ncbi:MAG: DUF3990 domain-containing protein [Acholeplasmatales bacterium]|nr:DUF3990 domain-containing protein [Acholeplasmatales bacterium]
MNKKIRVYHGSENIINNPEYGKGKPYNDYGLGFYMTEDIELAKEWAVDINHDGYANEYELDLSNLKILNISKEGNVLNWIALLLKNRTFNIRNDIAKLGKEYLLNNYLLPYDEYDVIIGYRADDSYFSFADSFLNNIISLRRLEEALKLGNLGEQIVLKSKKAFDNLKFVGYTVAKKDIYFSLREKRNEDAKNKFKNSRRLSTSIDDIYLNDIIRGGRKK